MRRKGEEKEEKEVRRRQGEETRGMRGDKGRRQGEETRGGVQVI
jgi:hypothetical protein